MDNYERMRKMGEEKARQSMEELNVDPTRIFDVSAQIREILDTGSANEIGFLQAMLEAAIMVIPVYYSHAKENEKTEE